MTLFEKISIALESLDIPVVRSFYKGSEPSYIIVSIYEDSEGFITDNESEGEVYQFKLTYWREGNQEDLTKKIKKLLKTNDFHRNYIMDTFDDNTYGVVFDYNGVLWNHEMDEEEE